MAGISAMVDLEVILAEDEEMFRDMALLKLTQAGVSEERVHLAEDGQEAIDLLDKLQAKVVPIIMLLDVRMPNVNGNQCADRIKADVRDGRRLHEPFMVCCSANIREVSRDEGNFHMTMPKNFDTDEVRLCITEGYQWCKERLPRTLPEAVTAQVETSLIESALAEPILFEPPEATSANLNSPSSGSVHNPSTGVEHASAASQPTRTSDGTFDLIVADAEPICRMALLANISLLGLPDPAETEDIEETETALREAQETDADRPLVLMLGNPLWLDKISRLDLALRRPFIINTSVDGVGGHAALPSTYSQADLQKVFDQSIRWWEDGCA